ncbi:MAG: sulfur carrier protein [Oceanospirillaceae bacterium]
MLNVSVNNNALLIEEHSNLHQLISTAGFSEQIIAVAVNGEFVPKTQYSNTILSADDQIDIVKPIGGG